MGFEPGSINNEYIFRTDFLTMLLHNLLAAALLKEGQSILRA